MGIYEKTFSTSDFRSLLTLASMEGKLQHAETPRASWPPRHPGAMRAQPGVILMLLKEIDRLKQRIKYVEHDNYELKDENCDLRRDKGRLNDCISGFRIQLRLERELNRPQEHRQDLS